MVIQCGSCRTRYHYDETRFGTAASKKIRCTKCANIFEIRNPAMPNAPRSASPDETSVQGSPLLGPDDFPLDQTDMGTAPRAPRRDAPGRIANADLDQLIAKLRPPATLTPAPPPLPGPARTGEQSTGEFPRMPVGPGDQRLKLPEWSRLSVACIAGPDAGRIFEIDKPRVVIGRSSADIVLTDAQCSRQHAALEVMEDQVFLVDLGSTNGTYVGEERVDKKELDSRSEFDLGATTMMLIKTRKDG